MRPRIGTIVGWALAFVVGCACPDAPSETPPESTPEVSAPGAMSEARKKARREGRRSLSDDQRAEIEALEAIGYLQGVEEAEGEGGVVRHDESRAYQGTNLVVSAHDYEILLVDMDGEVLHTWSLPKARRKGLRHESFRKARLLDDGTVVAIVEGEALFKLGRGGRVYWEARDGNHHDVYVEPSGEVVSLTREAHVVKAFDPDKPVLEDAVTRYASDDGEVLSSVSILRALQKSGYTDLWDATVERGRDPLHTNSVFPLTGKAAGRDPAFAAKNLLLSSRGLSAVFVLDPRKREIVWARRANFERQHDARILDDGQLMLFDNHSPDGPSAVRVYDPATMKQTWVHEGEGEEAFYSKTCSTAMPLPNGNVLVVASNPGLAFEVTPEGERVWEYRSPYRVGKDDALVANLFDVVRYPPADTLTWLSE